MHDALLGPEPAQLAVADQAGAEGTEIADDVGDVPIDDVRPQRLDGRDHDLITPADGEAEPMPVRRRAVGAQDDVCRRVVRIRIHRVRSVLLE